MARMVFNIGDRVQVEDGYAECSNCNTTPMFCPKDTVGTIAKIITEERSTTCAAYTVSFDTNVGGWRLLEAEILTGCSQNLCANHLRFAIEPNPIKSTTTMQKLTSTLKRFLSPELQKLYKANLIDGNLELTLEGKNEVWALLQKQFEPELVKVAEEKIAEEEKERK